MTVLSDRYDELRSADFSRSHAVQRICDEFGLDVGSVQRALNRAGRSGTDEKRERGRFTTVSAPTPPSRCG